MTDQTPSTCPACGVDLRYPNALHVVDCPAPVAGQIPSTENVLDAVEEYGKQCVDAVESFRCATPDLEDVRAALAARDREVAAKAWDEAHHAVYAFEGERYAWLNDAGPRPIVPMNPYRIGAGDE